MENQETQDELVGMKSFIGCKIIQAVPMKLGKFNQRQRKPTIVSQNKNALGYMVLYPDRYISWSPKDVFEEAYREINPFEKEMCQ